MWESEEERKKRLQQEIMAKLKSDREQQLAERQERKERVSESKFTYVVDISEVAR